MMRRTNRRPTWLAKSIVEEVDARAFVYYIGREIANKVNARLGDGELRLMVGWAWEAKRGGAYQLGLRSLTQAYIDCHCALSNQRQAVPFRPRLVSNRKAA